MGIDIYPKAVHMVISGVILVEVILMSKKKLCCRNDIEMMSCVFRHHFNVISTTQFFFRHQYDLNQDYTYDAF